jgi:glycosyltransferase involved in cell wall biosynthesis
MKAIFFTSNYYESPFQVGDHHLARSFAVDGWEVAFISVPITPFHYFSKQKRTLKERLKIYRSKGRLHQVGQGKILSYVPGAWAVPRRLPLLNSAAFSDFWPKLTHPSLKAWLNQHGFGSADLLYFSSSLYAPMLKDLPHKQSMLRIMDQEMGFRHFTEQDKKRLLYLAQAVDLVVYSAHTLEKAVKLLRPKQSLHLPNGVDLDNFLDKNPALPPEYRGLKKPIAVYVGAMYYWFDHALINQLTEALPDVNFVLIGPKSEAQRKLTPRPNLHLLGRRSYKDLPKHLYHANLGIIPFNRGRYPELVNAVNPLKLYEFAACGLPIVATRWDELERINTPAQLCDSKEDFVTAIKQALAQPPNPETQISFARQFDWSIQYQKLVDTLSTLNKEPS